MPTDHPSLAEELVTLGKVERSVIHRFIHRKSVARNADEIFKAQMTFGERVADRVAAFGGSWTFIGIFVVGMALWMIWNSRGGQPLDPFPYILLNLMLSCLAALQAPVIMMSQNRQAAKDRLDAKVDYEVNVRAEMEITRLHEKIDQRDAEIRELIAINRRQLAMLERLAPQTGA